LIIIALIVNAINMFFGYFNFKKKAWYPLLKNGFQNIVTLTLLQMANLKMKFLLV